MRRKPIARFGNGDKDKAPTGIEGFDEITGGGLPRGRATLVEGGAGSCKTIMALQTLVNGARENNEPGIFVAFEESASQITKNAAKFGWDLPGLQRKKLFFLDARLTPDLVHAGEFDLGGMLAGLSAKVKQMKARRIVLDAVDVMLSLLDNPAAERREMYRLHEWLIGEGLTAIITSKAVGSSEGKTESSPRSSMLQFMVDSSVVLNHEIVHGVSQRSLRVVKYRGSGFAENQSPFLIGKTGLEVAGMRELGSSEKVAAAKITERVSSGVQRLDAMLSGGYYRGASVLITGFPGTAKSTLSGAFAEGACERGERTLFFSYDSAVNEVIRNLASVNIRLGRFVKNGLLRMISARAVTDSAEIHLMQIKNLASEHRARCIVVDPISALAKAGNREMAFSVSERLVDWTKREGITLVCTSLLEDNGPNVEGTPLQISTIADTWIHLSYLIHAGERNRGLSIIKSRGTAHSNQVRELLLSHQGVTLADVYTAGGEVAMGTLRWEKEQAIRIALADAEADARKKEADVEAEEAELEMRLKALRREIAGKRAQRKTLRRIVTERRMKRISEGDWMRKIRGGDAK